MSISDYFNDVITQIKNEIEQSSEQELLNVETEELAEYYTQKYGLPLIEKDESRKINVEKRKSSYGSVPLKVFYPVLPKKNLHTVIERRSSRYFASGFPPRLEEGWLVTLTEMRDENSLKNAIKNLEDVIEWKNNDVRAGNDRIRNQIKTYVENKQKIIKRDYERLESIIEKVEIPLVVKREETLPVVDFSVKEELRPLIKPEPKKREELVLDQNNVTTLIRYIRNSCLSFEKTPKVYSTLEEEALRDIILGNLNAIFEGAATGETFSKLGKTDISLRISSGDILIIECKHWYGKEKYIDGINQLFRYLTWRENYGVFVGFSRLRGFTDAIRKAKEATREHNTFISGSMRAQSESEFVTEHRFPDDVEKKVEIHHLLFNLFAE